METIEPGWRSELLANIRRLTGIVLDRLEKGSQEGILDPGQMRMLGSIALRSLGLWQEALKEDRRRAKLWEKSLREAEAQLSKTVNDAMKGGEHR